MISGVMLYNIDRVLNLNGESEKLSVLLILFGFLLLFAVILRLLRQSSFIDKIEECCIICIILLFILFLFVPQIVHGLFYSYSEGINEGYIVSYYGDYITFIGTFGLGVFIFFNEQYRNKRELRKKARILYELIRDISSSFAYIDSYFEKGEIIRTDNSWKTYYYEISHLVVHNEFALESEISKLFNTVDRINNAIECKNIDLARRIYNAFKKNEMYDCVEYNLFDAQDVLLAISIGEKPTRPWKNDKLIDYYANVFFEIIDSWVYNYFIRNNLKSCEFSEIKYELVDWLMFQPDIKKWVKHDYDKRKITQMVLIASVMMNRRSRRIEFVWNIYSLK